MFDPSVGGVWTFDETMEEESAAKDFIIATSSGNNNPSFKKFQLFDILQGKTIGRSGLLFEEDKWFQAGSNFDFSYSGNYSFSIYFYWYSPDVLGFTKHVVTKRPVPVQSPILSKATTAVDSDGIEYVVSSSGEFIISEIGYTNSTNAIQVALCSGNSNPTHIFTSEGYEPGFHHVYIEMMSFDDGEVPSCVRIDIDGNRGITHFGPDAADISVTSANLTLNKTGFGYTAHKSFREDAIIADLVILKSGNTASYDPNNSIKVIRYGWQYITQSELSNTESSFHGLSFSQPTTITTQQIYSDGGNIYVARSNGEIVKGFQPIWDNEFNFSNPKIINSMNISKMDSQRVAEWSTDGLRMTGTTIRI